MSSDQAMDTFARDVVLMRQVGVNPVIVNGGGPMINQMLEKLGIKSEFKNGKRVTDQATMEVVEMVLSGSVNKRIVQAINRAGGYAVGLSGKDANLILCDQADGGLGLVGKPKTVNPRVLKTLFGTVVIPVISPLGAGINGETYNINGDTAAWRDRCRVKRGPAFAFNRRRWGKDPRWQDHSELTPDTIES